MNKQEREQADEQDRKERKYKEREDKDDERGDEEDWSNFKNIPENSVDFEFSIVQNEWGEEDAIRPELKELMQKEVVTVVRTGETYSDAKGGLHVAKENLFQRDTMDLWSNSGFLTRDVRLSNFNKQDMDEVRWSNELGYACLYAQCPMSASLLIFETADHSETSQARGMKLRENMRERRIVKRTTDVKEKNGGMSMFGGKKE